MSDDPVPRPLRELLDRLALDGRSPTVGAGPDPGTTWITGIADDSRRVAPGQAFVAVRGLNVDGHDFVPEAVARGAAAVIVERVIPDVDTAEVSQVVIDRGAAALASAAAWWYGDPSRELATVGVTGTNGKTTTSFLAATALDAAGHRTGLIGTVGIRIGRELRRNEEPNTTPGALELQRILREMRDAGETAVVLETSSHGLAAERVGSVDYDAAIFTNLSHEHLDFHGTFEAYRAAKLSLFSRLPVAAKGGRPGIGVVNADDPHAAAFIDATLAARARPVTYGTRLESDVRLLELDGSADGSRLDLLVGPERLEVTVRLPGRFNAHNGMAALALAHGWGLEVPAVAAALAEVGAVPGRMERVDVGQPFAVVIDFAHTPRAIDTALAELAPLAAPGRGVISLFGASGERDVGKRPLMGEAAARRSRLVIVTEDDSRHEEPSSIFEAIASGAEGAGARRGESLLIIADRREAIGEAFRRAAPGDVVALLGKGHETWNVGPDGPVPWSDREAAEAELRRTARD